MFCQRFAKPSAAIPLPRPYKTFSSWDISCGAALWGAMELARTLASGVIVVIFPDRGDRYASTALFE